MKKKILIAFAFVACLGISLIPEQEIHGSSSNGPAGYAGSPFDTNGRTCGSGGGCHGTGTTNQAGIITTNIPACGYTPGQTYNITVTASSPGRTKFGFSLSAQKTSDGVTAGTLIISTGLQLNGGGRYITHSNSTNAATASGTRVWNFTWTAPVAGTGSVSLFAAVNCTNSNGATSGDIIFNSSLAFVEGGLPAAPVVSAVGSTNICAGQTVTLNSTGSNVSWSTGATSSSIIVGAAGIFNATASNACGSVTSNNISVSITNPPAAPTVTAGPNGLQFCEGQSTSLTATSALPVIWSPGNLTTNQINVTTAGNFTASSSNNCGTTSSAPTLVIVDPLPTPATVSASGNTSFCIGDSVILSTNALIQYSWSNELSQSNITVYATGDYFVTTANECGAVSSDTIVVAADAPPETPEILLIGDSLKSSLSAPIYSWFFNGTPLNVNDSIISPTAEGEYTLILASNSGCFSEISATFNYTATKISSATISNYKVFPNPVLQNQWITFSENVPQNSNIEIFDLQGRRVYQTNTNQQSIQISLSAGTYIISNGTERTKLLVNQ